MQRLTLIAIIISVILAILLIIDYSVYTVDECFADKGELIDGTLGGCYEGAKTLGEVEYKDVRYFCCIPG